jgi:pilus assembly protein CpaF
MVARPAPRETPQQAARRLALITLVDRVADVVDLAEFERSAVPAEGVSQSIERAVREQAKAMRQEGEAPDGIDLDLLAREALRELVGLGPIGQLLEDDETTEIHVVRHDYVLAVKNGQTTLAEPPFTSEEALARVIARLAHRSGDPLRAGELVIDRRLSRGATMTAIAPPASSGWVLHVLKRRRVDTSLGQLVSSGAMSDAMAAFLEASAAVRANVLVVGSGAGAVSLMLGAIASAAPPAERVAVLDQGADEFVLGQAHVVLLALADHGPRGEESVYAAARLGVDRIIVTSLAGAVATATIDVIAEGSEGVLAGIAAPSLRHGLARLVSQVALGRAGSSVDAAREALGQSFDVVVEVHRASDGRMRVVRVAELEGSDERAVVTRDLFVLSTNGAGETSYRATGVSPRIAHDFGTRGLKL